MAIPNPATALPSRSTDSAQLLEAMRVLCLFTHSLEARASRMGGRDVMREVNFWPVRLYEHANGSKDALADRTRGEVAYETFARWLSVALHERGMPHITRLPQHAVNSINREPTGGEAAHWGALRPPFNLIDLPAGPYHLEQVTTRDICSMELVDEWGILTDANKIVCACPPGVTYEGAESVMAALNSATYLRQEPERVGPHGVLPTPHWRMERHDILEGLAELRDEYFHLLPPERQAYWEAAVTADPTVAVKMLAELVKTLSDVNEQLALAKANIEVLTKQYDQAALALDGALGERDHREEQITDIALALGIQEDWSNLYDLGELSREAASALSERVDNAESARVALRPALAKLKLTDGNVLLAKPEEAAAIKWLFTDVDGEPVAPYVCLKCGAEFQTVFDEDVLLSSAHTTARCGHKDESLGGMEACYGVIGANPALEATIIRGAEGLEVETIGNTSGQFPG